MQQEAPKSLKGSEKCPKTRKCRRDRPLEIEVDLNDSDVDTFLSLKRGIGQGRDLDLHILNGTRMTNPDQVLNWFWLLNTRPSKCRINSHFHCNLKTGALILAVVSDSIIPRWGSWYTVPSLGSVCSEIIDKGFGPPLENDNSSFSNLEQIHGLLSQFIDLTECTDKRVRVTRLEDFGMPLEFVCRDRFVKQVELPKG